MPALTEAAEHYKAQGYAVFADVTLEGATGRAYAPGLYCEREDGVLLVTLHEEIVRARDAVDAFAAARDCDARAACYALRGFTPEAARWASRLGVALVDATPFVDAWLAEVTAMELDFSAPAPEPTSEPEPEPVPAVPVAEPVTALACVPPMALAVYRAEPTFAPASAMPAVEPALAALAAAGPRTFAWPAPVDRVLAAVPMMDLDAFAPAPLPTPAPAPAPAPTQDDGPLPWRIPTREEVAARLEAAEAARATPADDEVATYRAFLWGSSARLGDLRQHLESEGAHAFGESRSRRSPWLRALAQQAAVASR